MEMPYLVNPLKRGQRASNFLKRKQQNQKRKTPETVGLTVIRK
jgi:hypothetical protein